MSHCIIKKRKKNSSGNNNIVPFTALSNDVVEHVISKFLLFVFNPVNPRKYFDSYFKKKNYFSPWVYYENNTKRFLLFPNVITLSLDFNTGLWKDVENLMICPKINSSFNYFGKIYPFSKHLKCMKIIFLNCIFVNLKDLFNNNEVLENLEYLELRRHFCHDKDIKMQSIIGMFKKLKVLKLDNVFHSKIMESFHWNKIKVLELGCFNPFTEEIFTSIKSMSSLNSLKIDSSNAGNYSNKKFFRKIQHAENLTKIHYDIKLERYVIPKSENLIKLSLININNKLMIVDGGTYIGLDDMFKYVNFKKLEKLHINNVRGFKGGWDYHFKMANLKSLKLWGLKDFKYHQTFDKLPKLETFYFCKYCDKMDLKWGVFNYLKTFKFCDKNFGLPNARIFDCNFKEEDLQHPVFGYDKFFTNKRFPKLIHLDISLNHESLNPIEIDTLEKLNVAKVANFNLKLSSLQNNQCLEIWDSSVTGLNLKGLKSVFLHKVFFDSELKFDGVEKLKLSLCDNIVNDYFQKSDLSKLRRLKLKVLKFLTGYKWQEMPNLERLTIIRSPVELIFMYLHLNKLEKLKIESDIFVGYVWNSLPKLKKFILKSKSFEPDFFIENKAPNLKHLEVSNKTIITKEIIKKLDYFKVLI